MDLQKSIVLGLYERKLTQKEVAKRAGISKSYLSEMKNGHRNGTLEQIQNIARVFDMKVSEFIALGE